MSKKSKLSQVGKRAGFFHPGLKCQDRIVSSEKCLSLDREILVLGKKRKEVMDRFFSTCIHGI